MLYKFRSRATAPVMLMARSGEWLLRIIGKPPRAHGVILHGELPLAIRALQSAVEDDDATGVRASEGDGEDGRPPDGSVMLRERARPLIEMMESAHAIGADVTWATSGWMPVGREGNSHPAPPGR